MVLSHLRELGVTKNKRIYIGLGRDGSSDDKISVDLKFEPNTSITYNKIWRETGYVKSSFAYYPDSGGWQRVEDAVDLRESYVCKHSKNDRPTHLAVLAYPNQTDFVAHLSVTPEFEEDPLYVHKQGFFLRIRSMAKGLF